MSRNLEPISSSEPFLASSVRVSTTVNDNDSKQMLDSSRGAQQHIRTKPGPYTALSMHHVVPVDPVEAPKCDQHLSELSQDIGNNVHWLRSVDFGEYLLPCFESLMESPRSDLSPERTCLPMPGDENDADVSSDS